MMNLDQKAKEIYDVASCQISELFDESPITGDDLRDLIAVQTTERSNAYTDRQRKTLARIRLAAMAHTVADGPTGILECFNVGLVVIKAINPHAKIENLTTIMNILDDARVEILSELDRVQCRFGRGVN